MKKSTAEKIYHGKVIHTFFVISRISKLFARYLTTTGEEVLPFMNSSEGTTTTGLQSDTDTLVCDNQVKIIQDIGEWQPYFPNLLMVRDKNTPHGYCLLQMMYSNVPLPVKNAEDNYLVRDRRGRVLMRNSWFMDNIPEGCTIHGPSQTHLGESGFVDHDQVRAYHCKSWPLEAVSWLQRETTGNWPSQEMKRQSVNDGCFVVPVGRRGTEDEELQWRISTSLTERTLIFSLNISQIRCYILMKMILKSYPDLDSDDALSSFICKTVLMHCIQNTQENFWQNNNLLSSLNFCLKFLYNCVLLEHCPHFIIHENNLMAGRVLPGTKPQLLSIIRQFILSNGRALLEIEIDQLGMRLRKQFQFVFPEYFTAVNMQQLQPSAIDMYKDTSGTLLYNFMICLSARNNEFLLHLTRCKTESVIQILSKSIDKLGDIYHAGNEYEQIASKLLSPLLCISLGSVLASRYISVNGPMPPEALALLLQGSEADISSSLNLASAFYCTGHMVQTEHILEHIEEHYNLESVQSVCGCYCHRPHIKEEFKTASAHVNADLIQYTAFCVKYLPCEFNCIPEELQHELFRSEFDPHPYRGKYGYWMDLAVVDFYFLQYKVYSNLGHLGKQQRAFINFKTAIDTDLSLGHRETVLNLLGQCMEQENRLDEALNCYTASTNIRPTNNAAHFHTSQVLQKINVVLE